MRKHGRFWIAAFMACALLLAFAADIYPSYNSEAGRKYAVACQRLSDLKRSRTNKKYRSYWLDCIRTFELVEQKYPDSPSATDACLGRAAAYLDLYQFNRRSGDLNSALQVYGSCQSSYPNHPRAPEALYRSITIYLNYKKDASAATKTFDRLASLYPHSAWTRRAKIRLGIPVRNNKPEPEIKKMSVPVITSRKTAVTGVVKSIRYWSGGAYTRIVIDQDKPIKYLAQELKNPDRLVFDILNARVDDSVNKGPLPVNDGILKQVRASQYAPDIVRVVLDLASIKSYVAFPLHDPDRLVIDVTGEGGKPAEIAVASDDTNTQPNEQTADEQTPEPKAEQKTSPQMTAPPAPKPPEIKNTGEGNLSLSRQMGLKIKTIAIDAGHGGHDPGAIGRNGLKEKDVTLDIAKRLAVLVKERLGCNVIMTRSRDVFIRLEDRPAIAKTKGADLFVSIHVNSNRRRNARGIETYVQGLRASDKDAMATAARENATTTKTLSNLDSELKKILRGLTKSDDDEESLYLADSVQGSLVNDLRPINRHAGDLKARMKRAFFYVLINTEMPSILAEVGFISNPEEEKLLSKDSYRQSIAEALCEGIKKYIEARGSQMTGI